MVGETTSELKRKLQETEQQQIEVKQRFEEKKRAASARGSLSGATVSAMNRDLMEELRPLEAKAQGFRRAIQVSQDQPDIPQERLEGFAHEVAQAEQERKTQVAFERKQREREPIFRETRGIVPRQVITGGQYRAEKEAQEQRIFQQQQPPKKEPTPLTMSFYMPPTPEEKRTGQFYKEMYGGGEGIISHAIGLIKEPFANISNLWGGKRKKDPMKEAFGFTPVQPSGIITGGTMMFEPTGFEKLSPEAKYVRTAIGTEMFESVKFEQDILQKRQQVLMGIESGGITELEAKRANIVLREFQIQKQKEYDEAFKVREEKRIKEFFPESFKLGFLPEWNYKPYERERELWEEGAPKWAIKTNVGFTTTIGGIYTGVREQPKKAAISFGVGVGVTLVTAGIGTSAVGAGIKATTVATASKVIGASALGIYGVSTIGKIEMTQGRYEKFATAGEILGTEVIPFAVGAKLTGYGIRRYTLSKELETQIKKLSFQERTNFEMQMKEAKAYSDVQPKVKELKFGEAKYIPKKAVSTIGKFIGARKRSLIVGGSVAEQTQLYTKPIEAPHDIDIYVKSMFKGLEGWKSKLYARQLVGELRLAGVERLSIPSKHPTQITIMGKKAIEFHPYTPYLKANIEQIFPFYKIAGQGITTTPSGVKVPKQSVQWQRMIIRGYTEKPIGLERAGIIRKSMFKTLNIQPVKYPQPFSVGVTEVDITKGLYTLPSSSVGGGKGRISYKPYTPYKSFIVPYTSFIPYKSLYSPIPLSPYKPYKPIKEEPLIPVTPYKSYKPIKTLTPPSLRITPYKPLIPIQTIIPEIDELLTPKKQEEKWFFGNVGLGWAVKKLKPEATRPFHYQPSVAALGLGIKSKKIPKLSFTGLQFRPDVPSYMIKKRKGRKK